MKILHLCLSCFYIDKFSYQENELVRQGIDDGHHVEIIASTETFIESGVIGYIQPNKYLGSEGAIVERIPYISFIPKILARKLRIHRDVYARINHFEPDVILFHGACGWEIRTAARYVRANPHVKLYVDSHEDFYNSARGWVSKWLLHYWYYRPILISNLDVIAKVLPVAMSSVDFLRDFYRVPEDKLEFFPLGGVVLDDEDYFSARDETRAKHGINADTILIVQSGKIDATKKLVEALEAFSGVDDPAMRFVVAGLVHDDIKARVDELLAKDTRVTILGWQTPDELRALLCAADVYCQPGTQSATMQMSVASRCAIILDDVASHAPYMYGNGWLVGRELSLYQALKAVSQDKIALAAMQQNSHKLALRMLDYRQLAKRICN